MRGYRHATDEFVDWYRSEPRLAFNRIVALRCHSHLESRQLAPGTVNLSLVQCVGSHMKRPAAAFPALTWLPAFAASKSEEARYAPRELVNGRARSRALASTRSASERKARPSLAALLLACGLRRRNAVALRFDYLQQRDERWPLLIWWQGSHVRTVPVPDWGE
jgi:hypothetical protein